MKTGKKKPKKKRYWVNVFKDDPRSFRPKGCPAIYCTRLYKSKAHAKEYDTYEGYLTTISFTL